jgi:hypothetical protein
MCSLHLKGINNGNNLPAEYTTELYMLVKESPLMNCFNNRKIEGSLGLVKRKFWWETVTIVWARVVGKRFQCFQTDLEEKPIIDLDLTCNKCTLEFYVLRIGDYEFNVPEKDETKWKNAIFAEFLPTAIKEYKKIVRAALM